MDKNNKTNTDFKNRKIPLIELLTSQENLLQLAKTANIEKYRFTQFFKWILEKKVVDPQKMSNIPLKLRDYLEKTVEIIPFKLEKNLHEEKTRTNKLLLETVDNFFIEVVLLNDDDRTTLCLSTQIGCPMNCSFCATGKAGFVRNLTANEMLAQFLLVQSIGYKIDNIVIMGMGEPFLNFENVKEFLIGLCKNDISPFSPRRITISTCGVENFTDLLLDLGLPVKLSISLHSPFNKIRKSLMPNAMDLEKLFLQCEKCLDRIDKRITFEYLLIDGLTDDDESINLLIKIAKRFHAFLNLIEFNEIKGVNYRSSTREKQIIDILQENNVEFAIRYKRGKSIDGACGQLVWTRINEKK